MSTLDYVNLISTVEKNADKFDKISIGQALLSAEKIRLPKSSSDRNIVESYREPANREFLKLNAKHIIDSECVVDGVLLVSPYCVMFRPAVVHLVENGPDKYSTVAFSDVILSIALYEQLPNGDDENAQHNRGESIDIKTSTQMPMSGDDTMPSYCLCLRVLSSEACRAKEFVNCNSLKLSDGEFGEGEFCFAIPLSEVDILYKFFVRWMPKKFANYEASEIFSDVQAPNVHANPKTLTHSKTIASAIVSTVEEMINGLPDCVSELALFWDEKLTRMKLEPNESGKEEKTFAETFCEMMKLGISSDKDIINTLCPNDKMDVVKNMVDSRNKVLSEGIREMVKHGDCNKNRCALSDSLENDPAQEAKEKRDLMRERKNKKISKLKGGVVKAEDVAGFRGQKSIDNILAFIEGGSSKMKNNLKKEKNNSTKKNDIKKYCDSNFNVKSAKKTENKSEISVADDEISKNTNFLFTNDVFALENSDKPENEEYSAHFVPVSRSRLLKNIPVAQSTWVKEAKPVIRSEKYKIPTASSVKFENSKEKSEKRKQKLKINPYSWPFILLKPENRKFDESESGKVVTSENVKITNSSNFPSNEISNKKKYKNEKSSNESHQNGTCLQRQIIKPPSN